MPGTAHVVDEVVGVLSVDGVVGILGNLANASLALGVTSGVLPSSSTSSSFATSMFANSFILDVPFPAFSAATSASVGSESSSTSSSTSLEEVIENVALCHPSQTARILSAVIVAFGILVGKASKGPESKFSYRTYFFKKYISTLQTYNRVVPTHVLSKQKMKFSSTKRLILHMKETDYYLESHR